MARPQYATIRKLSLRRNCECARSINIGVVARGCSGCTCTPQGGENDFRRNLQGKFVSAPSLSTLSAPPGRARVIFRAFWGDLEVCVVYLVHLERLLKATTKKSRQLFEEKSASPEKSWLRLSV